MFRFEANTNEWISNFLCLGWNSVIPGKRSVLLEGLKNGRYHEKNCVSFLLKHRKCFGFVACIKAFFSPGISENKQVAKGSTANWTPILYFCELAPYQLGHTHILSPYLCRHETCETISIHVHVSQFIFPCLQLFIPFHQVSETKPKCFSAHRKFNPC